LFSLHKKYKNPFEINELHFDRNGMKMLSCQKNQTMKQLTTRSFERRERMRAFIVQRSSLIVQRSASISRKLSSVSTIHLV
jgi:hypothetical protein